MQRSPYAALKGSDAGPTSSSPAVAETNITFFSMGKVLQRNCLSVEAIPAYALRCSFSMNEGVLDGQVTPTEEA